LAAARAVFAERGYERASIKEIVERAGVTPPALYHYFQSKAGIYEAAAVEVNDIVIAGFEEAIAGHTSLRDKFTALIDCSVMMNARDPVLARFIVSSPFVVERHPELSGMALELGRTRRFFEGLVRDTDELAVPPKDFVNFAASMLWGLTRLAATAPTASEYAGAVRALHLMIEDSLFSDRTVRARRALRRTAQVG
jgi:AcrR family transcriptional regulator